MKKSLQRIMLLVVLIFNRNIFTMNSVVQYKYVELTKELQSKIEADPEVMRLQNDLAFIDSEIDRIDSKIHRKKSSKKKSRVSSNESTEKVRVPVANALNAFLPCHQRFDNFRELLRKAKFEKTTTLNQNEFKEILRKSKKKPDKIARYMSKKFDIYGLDATNGFEFNKEKKQSISHWIFRDGLDEYYKSHALVSEDSKKLAIFRSLRALNVWGADLNQENYDKSDYRGNRPLHYAAKSSNCDAVKFLCGIGVDVNVQNGKGTIPLLSLVLNQKKIQGSVERCITALSAAGSDITITDIRGKSVKKIIDDKNAQKEEIKKQKQIDFKNENSIPIISQLVAIFKSALSVISNEEKVAEPITCKLAKVIKRNSPTGTVEL